MTAVTEAVNVIQGKNPFVKLSEQVRTSHSHMSRSTPGCSYRAFPEAARVWLYTHSPQSLVWVAPTPDDDFLRTRDRRWGQCRRTLVRPPSPAWFVWRRSWRVLAALQLADRECVCP